MADKAQYEKPSSQRDLEARLDSGNKSFKVLSTSDQYEPVQDDGGRDYVVQGNSTEGYVGVSGEYATYANESEAPVQPDEESAESKVIQSFADQMTQLDEEGRIGDDPEVTAADEEESGDSGDGDSGSSFSPSGSTFGDPSSTSTSS